MYSGLVLTRYSGLLMGAHQKIDRVARRHLEEILLSSSDFPSQKSILKFEGINGPDGIKRKSPSRDEPWHFLNPLSQDNDKFLKIINDHFDHLVNHLKESNQERAAFEAAWLAHAIVDGLTPAHHYPLEDKIKELRNGEDKKSRNTISKKLIFKGDTVSKTINNTLKAYGPRGLMSAHGLFELGFTFLIKPLRFPDARPKPSDLKEIKKYGADQYFLRRAREVAILGLFETYLETGWTPKLSNKIRHELAPLMIKTVTVIWYHAAYEAKHASN